jgi:hypothetical protein
MISAKSLLLSENTLDLIAGRLKKGETSGGISNIVPITVVDPNSHQVEGVLVTKY